MFSVIILFLIFHDSSNYCKSWLMSWLMSRTMSWLMFSFVSLGFISFLFAFNFNLFLSLDRLLLLFDPIREDVLLLNIDKLSCTHLILPFRSRADGLRSICHPPRGSPGVGGSCCCEVSLICFIILLVASLGVGEVWTFGACILSTWPCGGYFLCPFWRSGLG